MVDSSRLNIRTSDIRACRFFFKYIQKNIPQSRHLVFDDNNPDTPLSCRIINDALELYLPDPQTRQMFIRGMELALSTTILADKNFAWLKNDTRATFWMWGSLCLDKKFNQSINKELDNNAYTFWYRDLKLPDTPSSHHERLTYIVAFIDYLCINTANTPAIRRWLTANLNLWRKYAINLNRFKWLNPEDSDNCVWAYRSLKKYQQDYHTEESNPLNPVTLPSPVNSEEAFHTFYALLDLWEVGNDTQAKAIAKLKKAFYQKTFRQKQAARKGREDLSDEHVKKLAFLVNYYRSDKTSVIEMLIDDRVRGINAKVEAKQTRQRYP